MGSLPTAFPESFRSPSYRSAPKLPRPLLARIFRTALFCLPILAAGLLAGCISDGPNQTGSDYLGEHGIILANPMYHVKIKGFPVDQFWTTDAEPSHLNDTILLAGVQGAFTAEPRFAFDITDTSLLDSLSATPTSLRLSLSTPIFQNVGSFTDNGVKALESLADSSRDSLSFSVLSWDFTNQGISDDAWNDSVTHRNRLFLINGDTLARLPLPTTIDTVRLKVAGAYSLPRQLQANALPHLLDTLSRSKGHLHLIQMRMIPLPDADTTANKRPAMLRLGGNWIYDLSHRPSLLFGRNGPADSLDGHNRLGPLDAGNSQLAASYTLRYAGPRTDMVVPLQRGLHVTFDRARLLDSIDSALARQHYPIPARPAGPLSLQYYVPFAAITLPIDTPQLEAGLPVQVRLVTSVDTLLGDTLAGTRVDLIPLDGSVTAWYTTEIGHPEVIENNVSLSYAKADSLRRIILSFSKDTTRNDTVFLPVGGTGQINASLTGYGQSNSLVIQLQAGENTLSAKSYLSVRSGLENNSFRDPVTGDPMPLDSLVPRFVQPESRSIRLRATGGIRTLLNRALMGTTARQDFEFRPYFRAFNPKAAVSVGDSVAHEVVFPVLSVIPPRIDSGAVSVDFDLYLYPLKAR